MVHEEGTPLATCITTAEYITDLSVPSTARTSEDAIREELLKARERVVNQIFSLGRKPEPPNYVTDVLVLPADPHLASLITDDILALLPLIHRCWSHLRREKPEEQPETQLVRLIDTLAPTLLEDDRQTLYRALLLIQTYDEDELPPSDTTLTRDMSEAEYALHTLRQQPAGAPLDPEAYMVLEQALEGIINREKAVKQPTNPFRDWTPILSTHVTYVRVSPHPDRRLTPQKWMVQLGIQYDTYTQVITHAGLSQQQATTLAGLITESFCEVENDWSKDQPERA